MERDYYSKFEKEVNDVFTKVFANKKDEILQQIAFKKTLENIIKELDDKMDSFSGNSKFYNMGFREATRIILNLYNDLFMNENDNIYRNNR